MASIENMKAAILNAVADKRVTALQIAPEGRVVAVYRLKNGLTVGDELVTRIYGRLLTLDSNLDSRKAQLDSSPIQTLDSQEAKLDSSPIQDQTNRVTIKSLQAEIETLRAENNRLKAQLDSRLDSKPVTLDSCTIQEALPTGWYLVQRRPAAKAQAYWYAGTAYQGKQVWVYVGLDKERASSKITAWLAKRPQSEGEPKPVVYESTSK